MTPRSPSKPRARTVAEPCDTPRGRRVRTPAARPSGRAGPTRVGLGAGTEPVAVGTAAYVPLAAFCCPSLARALEWMTSDAAGASTVTCSPKAE